MAAEEVDDEAHSDKAKPATRATKLDIYIDGREYKVFTVGSLLRETEAQSKLDQRYFNHRYTYHLLTAQELKVNMLATEIFFPI